MKVKGISIWEPWASLMATGAKRIETRGWYTSYRGPLLICASKKRDAFSLGLLDEWRFQAGLAPLFGDPLVLNRATPGRRARPKHLGFGNALALVDLLDCVPTREMGPGEIASDAPFGNFTPGRFAWVTTNLRRLQPFPVRGAQRLFDVEVPEPLPLWPGALPSVDAMG